MYNHTHCKRVRAGTPTPILEYDMSMCNYMANAVMIWCLNISTDLCCTGIVAIHSQGQAWRQQHETHECECVHPTRELAVQLGIFMTGLIAQGPREDRPEKRYRKHVVNHEGERDGWIRRDSFRLWLWKSKRVLQKSLSLRFSAQLRHEKTDEAVSWHLLVEMRRRELRKSFHG